MPRRLNIQSTNLVYHTCCTTKEHRSLSPNGDLSCCTRPHVDSLLPSDGVVDLHSLRRCTPDRSYLPTMAITNPFASPQTQPEKMTLPMPPPLLHTRSGNELYERPMTPTSNHIVSPQQTPQGSPSKNQFPPGAHNLPDVFENAMKLQPLSPTKSQPKSPSKSNLGDSNQDPFTDKFARPESPTRQSNKENAPSSPTRSGYYQNSAAHARNELYQRTETRRGPQTRALTAEELEKLQLPKVKRLANVTQLCKSFKKIEIFLSRADPSRLPRPLLRSAFLCTSASDSSECLQRSCT